MADSTSKALEMSKKPIVASTKRITAKYQDSLTKSASSLKKNTPAAAKKATSAPTASKKSADQSTAPGLDVNSTRYDGVYREARTAMGKKPIHAEDKNRIDHILRVFDFNPDYGPCVGMSRLERWDRAHDIGLEPPVEIKEILLTQQGQTEDRYAQTVLHNHDL